MRDATFWFFYTASIWVVLLHNRQKAGAISSDILLMAGSCLVLLAVWSRVEALVLLPATCLFIAVSHGERKMVRLLAFLLPWICLAGAGWFVMSVHGYDILSLIRIDEVAGKIFDPAGSYQVTREGLKALVNAHGNTLLGNFLQNAYHSVWLIAIGVILSNAMESFFYPYVLFYLIGIGGIYKYIRQRTGYLYMAIIFFIALCLLYVHIVHVWIMTYRFIAILIIPSCVLAGLGLQKTCHFLSSSFRWREKNIIALLVIFIVSVALYKNLHPIERDKVVYVQIGDKISQLAGNSQQVVGVAGKSSVVHMWIAFYANSEMKNPACHLSSVVEPTSVSDLKMEMKGKGFIYFLWEEFSWKSSSFGKKKAAFSNEFEELGHWYHCDSGELVLFQLKE
jgi:hypothetical protein